MLIGLFTLLRDTLFILNILFTIIIIFYERKNPATTWAWLMVVLILPYFGFLIYIMLGMDSRKHRVFLVKTKEDDILLKNYLSMDQNSTSFLNEQLSNMADNNLLIIKGAEHLNDMVYLNLISGNGALTTNNSLDLFHEGTEKFEALFHDIDQAKEFIHIQYYIVHNDSLGQRIISSLAKKAAEGLEVKFYVDGMGSYLTSKKFYEPLIHAGGEVCIFFPPHFIRVNFRNHRKLCIIDGKIGYLGGINIGNEYLGKSKRFGFWRDTHVRIVGDAVKELEIRFIMDWNFSAQNKIILDHSYFPKIEERNADINIQVVSSGPDTRWPSIHYAYTKMVTEANHSIYIETPYFVPDDSIFEALRIAALSGIDVRIIIPAKPDHPFVYWASLSYLGELLESGVKCYKYEKGFIHSKLMLIDGFVSSVGTANVDIRSFKLNFETNAFIYNEEITKTFEEKFMEDLTYCTEINREWYESRSNVTKIKESISRLLSPLL